LLSSVYFAGFELGGLRGIPNTLRQYGAENQVTHALLLAESGRRGAAGN
jgi:hypothetical protein